MELEDVANLPERLILSLQQLVKSTPTPILCYLIIALVPPVATFLYFWGLEFWAKLPGADRLWIWVVILPASYAIMFPPELPGYLSIICGPGSVIHIIRAVEFSFVLDVPRLKRLRRKSSNNPFYAWEAYPPPLTISRGIWLIDLMTSIRGIGWTHGPRNRLPPASLILETQSVSEEKKTLPSTQQAGLKGAGKFIVEKGLEVFLSYLWIDFYQSVVIRSDVWNLLSRPDGWDLQIRHEVVSWLLTPWVKWIPTKICIYAAIQLSCSLLALIDVGLGLLGNEAWQYPPIFGSSIGVMKVNFQAIWGEWWHDLFRFTFLGVTDWVIRSNKVSEGWEDILVLSIPFLFYSAIHASLSYSVSHDALASILVIFFGGIQPLVISAQVRLRQSAHPKKQILHDLTGLAVLLNTFGLLLGNPGVLHSLASFPIPVSVWRKGLSDVGNGIVQEGS